MITNIALFRYFLANVKQQLHATVRPASFQSFSCNMTHSSVSNIALNVRWNIASYSTEIWITRCVFTEPETHGIAKLWIITYQHLPDSAACLYVKQLKDVLCTKVLGYIGQWCCCYPVPNTDNSWSNKIRLSTRRHFCYENDTLNSLAKKIWRVFVCVCAI